MVAEVDAAGWPGFAILLRRTGMKMPSWKIRMAESGSLLRSMAQGHFVCLVLLAAQFGLQPLLAKRLLPKGAFASVILLSSNAMKILISAAVLLLGSNREQLKELARSWTFRDSTLKAGLPSALFAGQGWLIQVGQTHLDSLTFNLLNQTKTLSAALICYLMLGRRQSLMQCFALFLLFLSALLLAKKKATPVTPMEDLARDDHFWLGVVPVLCAVLSSGLTAALTQRALKGSEGRNSWLYSMEISIWGSFFLICGQLIQHAALEGTLSREGGWLATNFQGWSAQCILPISTQACGGILVGLVTKYSDAVKKGFALVAGIVLKTVSQAMLEDTPLTSRHLLAAVLVAVSTVLHSTFPPQPQLQKSKTI